MPLAGFEPATPESERPQTHFLDRATVGVGQSYVYCHIAIYKNNSSNGSTTENPYNFKLCNCRRAILKKYKELK
jgi:hypothetical protein